MLFVDILKELGSPGGPPSRPPVTKFGGDRFELNVKFEAASGITILFGASGAGKTSTLKCLAGVLRPDSGRILADGSCLFDSSRGIDVKIRERRAGYVFQNLALFPHLTALDNVQFGIKKASRAQRKGKALALMEAFGISHVAARRPAQISGGEAQRVALARALAADPLFLLLDEPLSSIDEATKLGIIADIKAVNGDLKLPIIYVTHSRDEAITLGERVVVFEQGRVAAIGEPIEVFGAPVSSTVARLTGVENIFDGRVMARNEAWGFMSVQVSDGAGSCVVEAPLGNFAPGEPLLLALRSGDILLATEEPRHTSARNVFCGQISELEQREGRILVKIVSGVTWIASVTRQAADELGLIAGANVWIAFKAHSCYLLDK
jgi:molybdate transport system ATP-binding protein